MELNEKTVEVLATTLKVEPSKLKEQLIAPGETKINDLISDREIFTHSELETLKKNIQHDGYEKGKFTGIEMEVKNLKEKVGLKGVDNLKTLEEVVYHYTDLKTKEFQKAPDEITKQLKLEKEALQKNYLDLEGKLKSANETFEGYKTNMTTTLKIDTAINYVNIDAEDSLIAGQKEMLRDQFLKNFKVQIIDGKEYVINSNGEKILDKLQNPMPINEVIKDFAPKYVKIKSNAEGGRGGKSSQNTLPLSGELARIKDKSGFELHLRNKGINPLSKDGEALYREWRKANPDAQ